MRRCYLLVEGQTEEAFVRELLAPHCALRDVYLTPILLRTSPGHKGGVKSFASVRRQIVRLCRQDRDAFVTTMIDLYALPNDFPGLGDAAFGTLRNGGDKARHVERCIAHDVEEPNFFPYLAVHEFEALLFVDPNCFAEWTDSADAVRQLREMAAGSAPEDINDGPSTAPSKRILGAMPAYDKTFHGPLMAASLGLDRIRAACPHFSSWLTQLEGLAAS